ncbi:MAG: hypothetical protein HXS54_11345 [Theionarchaea archaeon]|nr:hypothetical protein [Theionarchaea archaeon]
MDRTQKVLITVGCLILVGCAVAFVAASTRTTMDGTPLFAVRMEQESNKMNFLPGEKNGFAYSSGQGFMMDYDTEYCSNAGPLAYTWISDPTCWTTCSAPPSTCQSTCSSTCSYTCVSTCCTCVSTCSSTCMSTCTNTCWESCSEPCGP